MVAHKSIYGRNTRERNLRVSYALPEKGTNLETGVLFLLPAYGGNLDSKVYLKMRREFPNKYNLIVVQCDYFGILYMGEFRERVGEFLKNGEKIDVPNRRRDDAMVSIEEKKALISNIDKAALIEVSSETVDGKYFKESQHGLGVDLLNLYEAVEGLKKDAFTYKENLEISPQVVINRNGHTLKINYRDLKPQITWIKPEYRLKQGEKNVYK